jgi:predicted naringenin-chalcone synthase
VQELLATPLEKLVEIPGIGEKTAEKVIATAKEYLESHPPSRPGPAPVEMEFTPEMEPAPEGAAAPADGAAAAVAATETAPDPAPAAEGERNV